MKIIKTKILILLLIILLCLYFAYNYKEQFQNYNNISYKINKCQYVFPKNIKDVFEENNINQVDNINSSKNIIYVPCTYDDVEKEILHMNLKTNVVNRVFAIHNVDEIVAKEGLWKTLVEYYGLDKALEMSPMSYVLYEKNDLKRLKQDFDESKLYILKKNLQRQEGLKITNNFDEILKNDGGYVLVQELLQDPYLIKGRKINLRVYTLLVCYKNHYEVYVYNDGFMYYTKDLFKKNSLEFGPNVTTGYIDRWVYDVHPLTHQDFKTYLDSNRPLTEIEKNIKIKNIKLSNYIFDKINKLIANVFKAFKGKIGNGKKLYNEISFQLFGIDVAIDEDLNAKIMEVNKGPDLGSKDKRDGDLKRGVIKDMLKIIKAINDDSDNNFIKVLELN